MRAQSLARRTFVHFLTLGDGKSEDQQVTDRNPHQELDIPDHCYAYVFYDCDVVTIEREEADGEGPTEATSVAYNISGIHYRVARKLAKDGSPRDRMMTAAIAQMLEQTGQPEPELVEVYDPDTGEVLVVLSLKPDEVIVREPHSEAQATRKRDSRRHQPVNCATCSRRDSCLIRDLMGGSGSEEEYFLSGIRPFGPRPKQRR